jgi:hypothetical protein
VGEDTEQQEGEERGGHRRERDRGIEGAGRWRQLEVEGAVRVATPFLPPLDPGPTTTECGRCGGGGGIGTG